MPFIGQQPTTGAFLELDSLTASATDQYTLQLNGANYYPESVNNLLVSINGVIQGSSTMSLSGYTLTVGATLSDSDVIDFVRVFGNVGTISTPTDGSVTANKIGTGAVTNAKISYPLTTFSSTGIDDNASSTSIAIDANGHVTMPNQPAFSVHKNGTNQNNLSTSLGTTVTFSTERFDVNSDFDTSNSTFTAPVTGKYFLTVTLRLENTDTASDFIISKIITSNEKYSFIFDPNAFDIDSVYFGQTVTVLADMDANDTAYIEVRISGGTAQTDVEGNPEYTYFTGYLVA